MEIAKPTENDFKRIADIHNEADMPFHSLYSLEEKEVFGEDLETEDSIRETAAIRELLVAKNDEGVVLGYVVFRKKNIDTVWISSLFVDPKEQNKGIGKKLIEKVEVFAKENDIKVVALETHRSADWAINFYKKNGYEIINDRVGEYPFNKILDKLPVPNRPLIAKIIT